MVSTKENGGGRKASFGKTQKRAEKRGGRNEEERKAALGALGIERIAGERGGKDGQISKCCKKGKRL